MTTRHKLSAIAITVASFFSVLTAARASGVCVAPAPDLANWWPWEQSAADTAGGQDAELRNGITFAPGKVGQALIFDGSNDYAVFGDELGNFGAFDFTIDFWIRTTSTRNQGVLEKRPYCSSTNFWGIRMLPSGQLIFELDQDALYTNYIRLDTTRTINDGSFHHVALVREGARASVYIDGVLDVARTAPGVTVLTNSSKLVAGASVCSGMFAGALDELDIFDRALSSSEIQRLFEADSAGKCTPVTLTLVLASCTTCREGDQFTLLAEVVNPNSSDIVVECKAGLRHLDGTTIGLLAGRHVEMRVPAGLRRTWTLLDTPVPSGAPIGRWRAEAALLEPDFGKTIVREVKAFSIVP